MQGSVEAFAKVMNEKAKELNMKNTHFVTPNGLDDENHYSSAYDMAILANYALKNDTFKKIVGTKSIQVNSKNSYKTITNTNELLGNYPGIYGVKTGFTFGAGRCLISACKQTELDIIVVVLGANTKKERTIDSVNILNYVNTNYKMVDLSQIVNTSFKDYEKYFSKNVLAERLIEMPKLKLEEKTISIYPINKKEITALETKVFTILNFKEQLQDNTKIGVLQVYEKEKIIAKYDILLENTLIKKDFLYYFFDILKNYASYFYKI